MDWVCLAPVSNCEHGAAISHYILQKKRDFVFLELLL
jgi:hypothetical protein